MSPSAGKPHTRKTAAAAAEPPLKCPRCDSPNTKFCYYNNYSLTQPRHFCKTCRRYWTKGGALRTVPIGGGCRKNKKIRSSPPLSGDSSADGGGLKFFQGVSPAMDFNPLNFNRPSLFAHFPGGANPYSFDSSPLIGFDFPEMGFRSSIESLSSINQDLHWKMQKQRLAMMLPTDDRKTGNSGDSIQPILFENLESPAKPSPRKDGNGVGNLSTEWFFNNSFAAPATSNAVNAVNWPSSDLSQYSSIP